MFNNKKKYVNCPFSDDQETWIILQYWAVRSNTKVRRDVMMFLILMLSNDLSIGL